ncbi:PIG-L family deacetylase [Kineococcus sp. TBRC 1896]|uniref:PIG-L family deacetylase n=2 Tax=Kineococcus mangrovi TaxID=1660183 RepID=A0ABV4HXZ7_9ACTN
MPQNRSPVTARRATARWRTAGLRAVLGLVAGFALLGATTTPAAAAGNPATVATDAVTCPAGAVAAVVAHPDDDLFFQNPDVLTSVRAGECVRTTYVTAGDGGEAGSTWYWQSRRAGLQAAYAQMAGVADRWTTTTRAFAGRTAEVATLDAAPRVSLVFLQLPDGNLQGQGFATYGYQSLQKLWQGDLPALQTIDGTQSYSLDDLVATIGAVVTSQGATVVRTLDYTGDYGEGDHSDHYTVGYLTRLAQQRSAPGTRLVGYYGYPGADLPANVEGTALDEKWSAYLQYARWDWKECPTRAACSAPGRPEAAWMQRRHTVDPTGEPTPDPTAEPTPEPTPTAPVPVGSVDVASQAAVTASSENVSTGQTAVKAVDGVVDGYPGEYGREWATAGGGAGSWLALSWGSAVRVDRVVLFDRPNGDDEVVSGRLVFDDGSSVPVGVVSAAGTTVSFPAVSTRSVRFEVTGVSPSTRNVGLAELQVWTP